MVSQYCMMNYSCFGLLSNYPNNITCHYHTTVVLEITNTNHEFLHPYHSSTIASNHASMSHYHYIGKTSTSNFIALVTTDN